MVIQTICYAIVPTPYGEARTKIIHLKNMRWGNNHYFGYDKRNAAAWRHWLATQGRFPDGRPLVDKLPNGVIFRYGVMQLGTDAMTKERAINLFPGKDAKGENMSIMEHGWLRTPPKRAGNMVPIQ